MIVSVLINNCPIQIALVNKISKEINIDMVFMSKNLLTKKKKTFFYFIKRVVRIPFELPFRFAWDKLKQMYNQKHPNIPSNIEYQIVNNINSETVLNYIRIKKPSLLIVSATTMIRKEIIREAQKNNSLILNLHTGVSPYIKGGPNCTNWCLANNYYLIGNTIMKLDEGIDSGAIIATEQTKLTGNESLFELHHKVMEHGFDLYIKVITCYVKNKITLNSIPQNSITTKGSLFYTKDWTILKVIKAYYNYLFLYKKGIQSFKLDNQIKLFPFLCENEKRR